ncbi:MAG: metal-dependent transcriptional regulator [Elusimicrobia bacterium]|nr:metal-dependent transcriptional regulator [Elusimicrobiota bacterium]
MATTETPQHYPLPTPQEECLEQALSILWQLQERNENMASKARQVLNESLGETWTEALHQKLIIEQEGLLNLSETGRAQARLIIRRHRLTERLLHDVLDLPPTKLDSNACRLEHVITSDVEEAICTLLGHPQSCPHGQAIPRERCCELSGHVASSIIRPLSLLSASDEGRVSYFAAQNRPELHRLLSLGLAPGVPIRVTQTAPACVVTFEGTLVAMEPEIASNIFIRLKKN